MKGFTIFAPPIYTKNWNNLQLFWSVGSLCYSAYFSIRIANPSGDELKVLSSEMDRD
jgi:hypothetical protein